MRKSKVCGVVDSLHTNIFGWLKPSTFGRQFLNALNISEKQIQLFSIDFIEHCFPTTIMTFISFDYLGKYGSKPLKKQ